MKRCSVQLSVENHDDLSLLTRVTGLSVNTLVCMMLSDWTAKHAGPKTEAGKALKSLRAIAAKGVSNE